MKLNEALAIINGKKRKGYMVHFEVREGGVLRSDYFPDKHEREPLIQTEEEAWSLANRFAESTDENTVNIYVVDNTFSPVSGYDNKRLKRY